MRPFILCWKMNNLKEVPHCFTGSLKFRWVALKANVSNSALLLNMLSTTDLPNKSQFLFSKQFVLLKPLTIFSLISLKWLHLLKLSRSIRQISEPSSHWKQDSIQVSIDLWGTHSNEDGHFWLSLISTDNITSYCVTPQRVGKQRSNLQ